jgi:hypothetical protein
MVTLVRNVNVRIVKVKATVCVNASSVKEVEDLGDDEGTGKAEPDVRGVTEERASKRWAVSIVYKTEGGVNGGVGVTGVRTDGERGNPEEVCLELVSRGNVGVMMDVGFKWGYRREGRGVVDKIVVSLVA